MTEEKRSQSVPDYCFVIGPGTSCVSDSQLPYAGKCSCSQRRGSDDFIGKSLQVFRERNEIHSFLEKLVSFSPQLEQNCA